MEQLKEFFTGLFSTAEWPARWFCGEWSDFQGWLYIISDGMIWIAYSAIPLIILHFLLEKRSGLKFPKVYLLFAAFILLCGTTHFLDAMMFWIPMYRLNTLVRFITGIVSLTTVFYLIKILPDAFKLKTNAELEAEISRREQVELKLAEANKGLEAFVYMASHDLQEPLRKIAVFASLLNEKNRARLDDQDVTFLNKILSSSLRMQTMIKEVLSLATLPEKVELTNVNVESAIQDAISNLEIKISERQAQLTVAPIPPVVGNQAYLSQLFLNLIGNSIKFSNRQPVIKINGEQRGNHVLIYLSDNGIGMSEEDSKKIFDTFHRLHPKSAYEGSGIGLAICKKIVDIHGGEISVQSVVDQGTTFTIRLKAANSSPT